MKNLHKLLTPLLLFAGVFVILASCQSVSANDSSVLTETASEVEQAVCADLTPDTMSATEFESLPAFAQEYVAVIWAAWDARCG